MAEAEKDTDKTSTPSKGNDTTQQRKNMNQDGGSDTFRDDDSREHSYGDQDSLSGQNVDAGNEDATTNKSNDLRNFLSLMDITPFALPIKKLPLWIDIAKKANTTAVGMDKLKLQLNQPSVNHHNFFETTNYNKLKEAFADAIVKNDGSVSLEMDAIAFIPQENDENETNQFSYTFHDVEKPTKIGDQKYLVANKEKLVEEFGKLMKFDDISKFQTFEQIEKEHKNVSIYHLTKHNESENFTN